MNPSLSQLARNFERVRLAPAELVSQHFYGVPDAAYDVARVVVVEVHFNLPRVDDHLCRTAPDGLPVAADGRLAVVRWAGGLDEYAASCQVRYGRQ
jgi:hypothetical protein